MTVRSRAWLVPFTARPCCAASATRQEREAPFR